MSSTDSLTLREQFELTRAAAVASTDGYNSLSRDDPARPAAWARAMQQTEAARQLLEAWLRDEDDAVCERPRNLPLIRL